MKAALRFRFLVAVTILAISGLAIAQDQSSDPPSRVARLQFIEGQVSLQPGGVDDWVDASLNRPLTTADRIWTDRDSRAELSMASAALRMGSETSVSLTNLDDGTAQIELDQGTLSLSVRYLNEGDIVEVDTPNFAYTVTAPGEYRFDVIPDQDQSWITVRHGDGEASGDGENPAVRVHGGERFSFSSGQSLHYANSRAPGRDDFDHWCEAREQQDSSSQSASYVAAGTVGYEDLDANGNWEPTPVYGTVWYPRVHEGWAPYSEGHWAWVEPWGWTWVDDAPWGFAPFHYGRWVQVRDRWGWVPGPVGVRPVYAPALVAWVGGPSFGVSIGIGGGGGVGWFPLGWHDPYLPSYRVSPDYARRVNISNSRVVNVTVVNNYYTTTNVNVRNTTLNNIRYENASVRGAVRGVSSGAFAAGKPIRGNAVVIPASAMGRGGVMAGATVVPTKQAVLGGRAPSAIPARLIAPRQVVSKTAPPPRPLSFEQQRPLLERSNGVPLSPEVRSNLRKSAPPQPAVRGGQPAVNQMGGRPQGGNQPGRNQPAGNQQGRQPAVNQPGGNQQGRPPVVSQPGGNQQGRQPAVNQPAVIQQGRQPAVNQPTGNQQGRQPTVNQREGNPAGDNGRGEANRPPNTVNRPLSQPATPANPNQNAVRPGDAGNAPVRNVPRPPQAGGNVNTNDNQSPRRPPVWTNENIGRAPANTNRENTAVPARPASPPPAAPRVTPPVQTPRNAPPAREAAPAQTPRSAPPAREATPAQPPRNAPPAREAAPAPQHKNAPPPKENKEKDKESK